MSADDVIGLVAAAAGSGLDPDISPASADEQADRVAKARRLLPPQVHDLAAARVHGRGLGFPALPRVNVPDLDRAPEPRAR